MMASMIIGREVLIAGMLLLGFSFFMSLPYEEAGNYSLSINISEGTDLHFETIARGYYSGQTNKSMLVITSLQELKELWNRTFSSIFPQPHLPDVDFSKEMIVAVFFGEHMTGGYSIQIERVVERQDMIEVEVIERKPGTGCFVTEAITSPYHIIKLEKKNKKVVFREKTQVVNCGK